MIVFTATEESTGQVFATSTKLTMEEYWAKLLEGMQVGEGAFFERLRKVGPDQFTLEEWGFAENAAEVRQMLREAKEDLGAHPIKPLTEKQLAEQAQRNAARQLEAAATVKSPEAMLEKAAAKPLRHTQSTEEAAEMRQLIAGIEARRRKSKPAPGRTVAAKPTPASKVSKGKAATKGQSDRLAEGRCSSSVKEKRIREAIAQQKMELEAKSRDKVAAEAEEMRQIMARLDERQKVAQRIHRRR